MTNDTYARNAETGLLSSGVNTADTAIKSAPGKVYWLTMSDNNDCLAQLNDSTDDSGTDLWQMRIPDNGYIHCVFDPPLEFATGIYLDVPSGEASIIVGYI